VAFVFFWFVTREWAPQLTILPFILLCTTSTSALWCLPHEVVVSLGPIPVCFFKRRIPYKDIASVNVVQGRLPVLSALVCRSLRLWRPFGFAYGLTFGKALVDIVLQAESSSGDQKTKDNCTRQPFLVSVDDANDIVDYVLFRQKHGADAPLPVSLLARPHNGRVKWVMCDLLDVLLRWHARNQTACDVFGLFLQPFQTDAWGSHARIA